MIWTFLLALVTLAVALYAQARLSDFAERRTRRDGHRRTTPRRRPASSLPRVAQSGG